MIVRLVTSLLHISDEWMLGMLLWNRTDTALAKFEESLPGEFGLTANIEVWVVLFMGGLAARMHFDLWGLAIGTLSAIFVALAKRRQVMLRRHLTPRKLNYLLARR